MPKNVSGKMHCVSCVLSVFRHQLGFTVDPDTAEAAKKLAGTLSKISAERIQTELVKLLVSPHPDYLRYAWEYGITAVVLPEFDRTMETPQNNPHHCYNVGEHTLEALRNIEADKTLRLAVLFHDFGKPQTHTTDADGIDIFTGMQRSVPSLQMISCTGLNSTTIL